MRFSKVAAGPQSVRCVCFRRNRLSPGPGPAKTVHIIVPTPPAAPATCWHECSGKAFPTAPFAVRSRRQAGASSIVRQSNMPRARRRDGTTIC